MRNTWCKAADLPVGQDAQLQENKRQRREFVPGAERLAPLIHLGMHQGRVREAAVTGKVLPLRFLLGDPVSRAGMLLS